MMDCQILLLCFKRNGRNKNNTPNILTRPHPQLSKFNLKKNESTKPQIKKPEESQILNNTLQLFENEYNSIKNDHKDKKQPIRVRQPNKQSQPQKNVLFSKRNVNNQRMTKTNVPHIKILYNSLMKFYQFNL